MKYIELTQGQRAIVDDEDYDWLNQFKWHAAYKTSTKSFVAVHNIRTNGKQTRLYMHRLILNAPKGMEVDHINHNTLDNRRINIRVCTLIENHRNMKPIKGTSRFKGVSWHRPAQKWRAQIQCIGEKKTIGCFYTEEEAALAYNEKATKLFGEFACLNVIRG